LERAIEFLPSVAGYHEEGNRGFFGKNQRDTSLSIPLILQNYLGGNSKDGIVIFL
jgi:hypothetical protein